MLSYFSISPDDILSNLLRISQREGVICVVVEEVVQHPYLDREKNYEAGPANSPGPFHSMTLSTFFKSSDELCSGEV